MATFAQYAMAAAQEALTDSAWLPKSKRDYENTVRIQVRMVTWS